MLALPRGDPLRAFKATLLQLEGALAPTAARCSLRRTCLAHRSELRAGAMSRTFRVTELYTNREMQRAFAFLRVRAPRVATGGAQRRRDTACLGCGG